MALSVKSDLRCYDGTVTETLRARTRRLARDEIARVAWELFLERGFDRVTMDDIAAAVGVSRRSLFRYVSSKEDIVLGDLVAAGEVIARALRARPVDESAWDALRGALLDSAPSTFPARALEHSRLLLEHPALRASHLEKRLRWQELLAPVLAERLGSELRARAIVAAALTCIDTAVEQWVRADGVPDLLALYDEAVAAVRS